MSKNGIIYGTLIGLFLLAGTATAAPAAVSNLTAEFVENPFFLPFWVTIAFMFCGMGLLIASTIPQQYIQKMAFTLAGILTSLMAAGSTFITGDLINVSESVYTVILYQSTPLLWFCAALALIGIALLIMYVISYTGDQMTNYD